MVRQVFGGKLHCEYKLCSEEATTLSRFLGLFPFLKYPIFPTQNKKKALSLLPKPLLPFLLFYFVKTSVKEKL